jgi:hypothetical protein
MFGQNGLPAVAAILDDKEARDVRRNFDFCHARAFRCVAR